MEQNSREKNPNTPAESIGDWVKFEGIVGVKFQFDFSKKEQIKEYLWSLGLLVVLLGGLGKALIKIIDIF